MKKITIPLVLLALCGGALFTVVAQDKGKAPAAAPAQVVAQAQTPAQPASTEAAATAPAAAASEPAASAPPPDVVCFESRKGGATDVTQKEIKPGWPNVKCSTTTGAALWYGDPYDGTVPMVKMPLLDKVPEGTAVIKPRTDKLALLAACGTACHNGIVPQGWPKDNKPIPIPTMESMMPELKEFQHGRGAIWCLDCHHPKQRAKLVDHFGEPLDIDNSQVLCGKCHGDKLRDWRDGIHGKRIGDFTSMGKKRWFTCTECHNPHNVQQGDRNKGFASLQPEKPPQLPRGLKDARHEKLHPIPH